MPMSKSKDDLARLKNGENTNFDIEVKGQGHTAVRNVRNTLYHGETLTCQTYYDYVKGQKSCGTNTKPCHTPYKLNLEVKDTRSIRIMNERNTCTHSDRHMCQIWYANVKANRSYG